MVRYMRDRNKHFEALKSTVISKANNRRKSEKMGGKSQLVTNIKGERPLFSEKANSLDNYFHFKSKSPMDGQQRVKVLNANMSINTQEVSQSSFLSESSQLLKPIFSHLDKGEFTPDGKPIQKEPDEHSRN